MCQTKEKCDSLVLSRSDLWMVWRCHGIPRVYCYYFYLEPTVRKDTWMRTASVTVMVTFFESGILKVTWSQLCSKSLLNKYEAHWQQHFERYPTVLCFTDMAKHQDVGKGYWNENRWKCLEKDSYAKRALGRTLHHIRKHVSLMLCDSLSHNLVFKFDIALIGFFFGKLMSTTIHFFFFWLTFDISLILKFIQCLYAFL